MELSIRGAREERPDSPSQAATEVLGWVQRIRPSLPKGAKWLVIDRSFERVPALDAGVLDKVLRTSPPSRKSERAGRRTTYDATLVCVAGGAAKSAAKSTDLVRLNVAFSSAEDAAKAAFFVVVTLSGELLAGFQSPAEQARSLFEDTVRAFRLSGATCSPAAALRSDPSLPGIRAGWLTYLSRSLGTLPAIPPPTEVHALDDLGWTVVAQRELIEVSNPEHAASIAYVRHALGARVLLDGPSFPPPSATAPAEPASAPVVPIPESQVPSYLKTPPAVAVPPVAAMPPAAPKPSFAAPPAAAPPAAAPSPIAAAPPAAAQGKTPLTTGTADINLSKILGPSLPFNPHAEKSSPAAPPAAPAPAASSGFGETESFDLAALLKRGPAVPFGPTPAAAQPAAAARTPAESAATAPKPAEPAQPPHQSHQSHQASPAPAEPRGHGRWIRFNPQTGEPLAQPRWEPLPEPPKK